MSETTDEMKAMARAIADKVYGPSARGGMCHSAAEAGALLAIQRTSEAAALLAEAELVEVYGDSPEIDTECNNLVRRVAEDLRTFAHLKGQAQGTLTHDR